MKRLTIGIILISLGTGLAIRFLLEDSRISTIANVVGALFVGLGAAIINT